MAAKVGLVYSRLPELAKLFPAAVAEIVRDTANEIANDAKMSMGEEKSGRVYVKKNNLGHQASAPGEAPAIDTTNLVTSIKAEMIGLSTAVVSASAEYSAALEFGTRDGKIEARPFFRPAVRKARKRFIERLKGLESRL